MSGKGVPSGQWIKGQGRSLKVSTHRAGCCIAANGASVKSDGAGLDEDAAALHPQKEMSVQRGDGGSVQESSEGERVLRTEDQVGVA